MQTVEATIKEESTSIEKLEGIVSAVTKDVMDVLEEDGVPQSMEFIVVAAVTKPMDDEDRNETTIITRSTCDEREADLILAEAQFEERSDA